MGLLQGVLLTGAAATGVVVVERVRHRGSGEEVREDVTEFGTNMANQVGKAMGFVGHAGGKVLGKTSEVADGLGNRTTQVVAGAGRTIARGAGVTVGVYAGAIDRVVPKVGGGGVAATEPAAKKSAPAKRAAARAKAS